VNQPQVDATTIDERNPWLGLASYTEETRAYFYGRDEEVAELARRVQRKLLTVLFGQSGLGKTSVLRAGLVPRLRAQGYCPIYVRIDYGRDSPEPAEQIKQAISRTARYAGQWTQAGVAMEGESLWEYLHHRDDVLRDEAGTTLIPLLIFDQFEEIFTLAQSDDFGRARAARFVEELSDLVENRPPKALEAKLEKDDSAAERFDFGRSDYRVLIALREDYLAPLESLKRAMPSISQNRLRLAPMNGTQALAAVLQPGKKLVSEEVAAAIVRFVAGGAELANAEVEPSLLSLICRELNDTRLAAGRSEISLDLLAGSHASILSNFYERALADQSPAIRQIIEEDLLTSSGYRENVAEERVLSRFKSVGADAATLATLVNRRLLRIEERLDVRRVELTHDVLCPVVKASRDARHEREAHEATERTLAVQRERELAARRALVRARQVASGCIVLAVLAVAAAIFGFFSTERARRAEHKAEQTRLESERARAGAEHLLGYLGGDVDRELESFGQLEILTEFLKRQIDYFHALPPELRDDESTRNGALAMVRYARAKRLIGGDLDIAGGNSTEGIGLLEALRARGDTSVGTAIALARGYSIQGLIQLTRNDANGVASSAKAVEVIRPLAEAPGATPELQLAYAEILAFFGYGQTAENHPADGVLTEQKAMHILSALGAEDLSNVDAAALFAESSGRNSEALQQLGRPDEARQSSDHALDMVNKVLERRPGNRMALHAQQMNIGVLTNVAADTMQMVELQKLSRRQVDVSLALLNLDPANVASQFNLAASLYAMGDVNVSIGHFKEALPLYQQALEYRLKTRQSGTAFSMIYLNDLAQHADTAAQIGELDAAAKMMERVPAVAARLVKEDNNATMMSVLADAMPKYGSAAIALQKDDLEFARKNASDAVGEATARKPTPGFEQAWTDVAVFLSAHVTGQANYRLSRFSDAEQAERIAVEARRRVGDKAVQDRRDVNIKSSWLAMAIARQGRADEAATIIAPVVKYDREIAARNHGDQWFPVEFAAALYAQALTDKARAPALLHEAAALIDSVAPAVRSTHDVRQWRERIAAGVPTRQTS
jgi:tetratricopeptide (TPR) repeat protein